ncbi:MAG: N-acetylmuramoyl-L-alanine amidase [Deltaproteobacteria bacterium]|nr:N-acetylmuramoyl-L-alanine amidase [Deltaproteobacteria bacterium]
MVFFKHRFYLKFRYIISFFLISLFLVSTPVNAIDRDLRFFRYAENSYYNLVKSPQKRKYRVNWIKVIKRYKKVSDLFPQSKKADLSLYRVGELYRRVYNLFKKSSDLENAIIAYQRLISQYPLSPYFDEALYSLGEIFYEQRDITRSKRYFEEVINNSNKRDIVKKAEIFLKKIDRRDSYTKLSKKAVIKKVNYWSNREYTRIVVEIGKRVSYSTHLLKEDRLNNKPPRLYFDFSNTFLPKDFTKEITIRDRLIKRIRIAQNRPETVRMVIDLKSIKNYRVFSFESPFRLIIDLFGKEKENLIGKEEELKKAIIINKDRASGRRKIKVPGLARVVIDPGHGGKDPGAIGPTGLKEKDVVLKIAKRLKRILKSNIQCEVILTREDDRYLSLHERTAMANILKADLFISIHANASRKRRTSGIETYFLSPTSDKMALRVAARENHTSIKQLNELDIILADLKINSKITESWKLAEVIHNNICLNMRRKYWGIKDLGVKRAPFYVLLGADMPAVLLEVSFISNPLEEKRLRSNRYLDEKIKKQ